MAIDYYQKYLKYKTKYLELKNQMGGLFKKKPCQIDNCNCLDYKRPVIKGVGSKIKAAFTDIPLNERCVTAKCNHKYIDHDW